MKQIKNALKDFCILHVASIVNSELFGVDAVVPQHVWNQTNYCTVGLLNIRNEKIEALANIPQFFYGDNENLDTLLSDFPKPDIVIVHEVYHIEFVYITKWCKKKRIPYIVVPHGSLRDQAQRHKHLKKTIANHLIFNNFLRQAACIQFLSDEEKRHSLFSKKGIVLTNGISIPKYKTIPDNHDIIYIGRLDVVVKGLDLLLDAIDKVRLELARNNCKIHIYGPDYGGRFELVKKMIEERNLQDFVVLHHEIIGKAKQALLLRSYLFIQTSRFEGMPMGILEAASYSIPCIITTGTSLGDLLNKYDAGWVADNNTDSIAECIKNAISSNNNWEYKSHNSRKMVENNFDWSVIAKKTVETYKHYC